MTKPVELAPMILLTVPLASGCFPRPGQKVQDSDTRGVGSLSDGGATDGEGVDTESATERQEREIMEYERLTDELEQRRSEFAGEAADEIFAVDDRLFWLEFPGWDPVLRSYQPASGQKVGYAFGIGGGDAYNYRASTKAVVTAVIDQDKVAYRMYAIDEVENLIAEEVIDAPKDEQRWWAYAVDGTTGYVVKTFPDAELYRFGPGQPLERVLDLEKDAGAQIGEFWEFGVDQGTMVFVESGRIWSLDLNAGRANWLGNEIEVTGAVNFEPDGAMYSSGGIKYFDYASKHVLDVDQAIADNDYELNQTFEAAHLHNGGDWTRRGSLVVYRGQDGIFSYDIEADAVAPILLDPRPDPEMQPVEYLTYRNPQMLRTGELFVQGLVSESGAVGADGPIYQVDKR